MTHTYYDILYSSSEYYTDSDEKIELQKQLSGSAGYDISASRDTKWEKVSDGIYTAIVNTGISIQLPFENTVAMIYPRSGLGFKHNIQLANGTGVIDSNYRGEIKVKLIAFSRQDKLPIITKGMRIAQLVVFEIPLINFKLVDEIETDTNRGTNGFGSTGVAYIGNKK